MKSMLRMNKNFIGLAVLATLLAGCQTAQINNDDYKTVNLDEMFPGYGADRRPANVTPILKEVHAALQGVKMAARAGATEVSAQKELLNYVNRLRSEEVTALKQAKAASTGKDAKSVRLTAEDMSGLSASTQAKIAADFLSSKGLQDLPQLNAIRAKVQDEMARIGGTDARTADAAMAAKLKSSSAAIDKNVKMRNAQNSAAKNSSSLQVAFKDLEDVLVRAAAGEKEAVELRRELFALRKTAGEVWEVTGDSHLIPETCENLDATTLPQYRKLLADIRDEFRGFSKRGPDGRYQRIACKNKDEITAYVAAKFQDALGRRGVSALTAVQEMTFCNYLKTDVGNAARKLASVNGGVVSKAPDCQ
jgi:hypothetical protein